jgi:hypothetical protein
MLYFCALLGGDSVKKRERPPIRAEPLHTFLRPALEWAIKHSMNEKLRKDKGT